MEGSRKGNGKAFVAKLREAQDWVAASIAAGQQRMEENANKRRMAAEEFKVGDEVWLDLRNINTPKPSKKLDWLHRKFTVTAVIRPLTYQLDTPPGIHNRFHSDLLRKAGTDPFPSQRKDDAQPPAIIDEDREETWEVEEVLCARTVHRRRQALVKWVGYDSLEWTNADNLEDVKALDNWEAEWGPIQSNDGPLGKYVRVKRRNKGSK